MPSKKNTYRRRRGQGMYRPKEVVAAIDSLVLQLKSQWHSDPLQRASVRARIFVQKQNRDLDNIYTALQDALVTAGVVANDSIKHIASFSAEAIITTEDEHAEITIDAL